MRTMMLLVTGTLALLMVACIPSLHPIYTEKDLVFDPGLLGTWADKEGKDRLVLVRSGEKSYDFYYTEEEDSRRFEGHLAQVGGYRFLDLLPADPGMKNEFYQMHLIRAHTFSRVWIEGDTLRLAFFDHGWVKGMIDQGRMTIAYERSDEGILLTAATAELQKLVVKYAEDPKAFPSDEFHRLK
jgi:hypothetical protein